MSKERVIRLINQNDTMTAAAVLADDLGLDYNVSSKIVQAYARGDKSSLNRAYIGVEDSSEKPKGKHMKTNKQNGGATIEDILKKYRNIWHDDINDLSFAVCPVPENLSGIARSHFDMGREESILFFYKDEGFWAGQRSFTAITDKGIHGQIAEDDKLLFIPWADVKEVQYKEYHLDFFDYDGEYWHWTIGMFTKDTTPEQGRRLAKVFNECANAVSQAIDPYDVACQLAGNDNYDEALKQLDDAASSGIIERNWLYHYYRGKLLVSREQNREEHSDDIIKIVKREFDKAIELSDNVDIVAQCDFSIANLYLELDYLYKARNYYIYAMDTSDDELRDHASELYMAVESGKVLTEIWDNYTSKYEYKERKFIMPIRDCDIAGCVEDEIDTFRMSNIPSCIKFPTGHPVANELYIGHPYNPNLYVPYSESEDIFFQDKIDELIYLLQCLGAEEIEITSIKGKSVSEYENRSGRASAHLDTGVFEGSGSGSKDTKRNQNRDVQLQRSFKIKCDPMKYPYVPEGLIWYGEQARWQRMVEGRLNGNRLEYSESVSSSDTRFVSNTEKKDIKAAAERLWIKVDGSAESNLETQFKEHTETQWRVDVKFRSLRDFEGGAQSNEEENPEIISEEGPSTTRNSDNRTQLILDKTSKAWDAAAEMYSEWIAEEATPDRLDSFLKRLETNKEIQFELSWRYFLEALFRYDAMSHPGINNLEQYIRAEVAIGNAILYDSDTDPSPENQLLKGLIAFEPVYTYEGISFSEKNKKVFFESKEYLKQLDNYDGLIFQGKEYYQEEYQYCELYFDNPTEFWRKHNEDKDSPSNLTEQEQEYLDEFKAVLEDGEIGPRERKSLERARVRLGISEARAAEIEASVSAPKLTDEEKAYLAEVKAVLEDGEIGPRERKSLERTRNRLGISEEKAKEIEKL